MKTRRGSKKISSPCGGASVKSLIGPLARGVVQPTNSGRERPSILPAQQNVPVSAANLDTDDISPSRIESEWRKAGYHPLVDHAFSSVHRASFLRPMPRTIPAVAPRN